MPDIFDQKTVFSDQLQSIVDISTIALSNSALLESLRRSVMLKSAGAVTNSCMLCSQANWVVESKEMDYEDEIGEVLLVQRGCAKYVSLPTERDEDGQEINTGVAKFNQIFFCSQFQPHLPEEDDDAPAPAAPDFGTWKWKGTNLNEDQLRALKSVRHAIELGSQQGDRDLNAKP